MAFSDTIGARQAAKEHVLAVSRDFISQPRLSKYFVVFKMIKKKFIFHLNPLFDIMGGSVLFMYVFKWVI